MSVSAQSSVLGVRYHGTRESSLECRRESPEGPLFGVQAAEHSWHQNGAVEWFTDSIPESGAGLAAEGWRLFTRQLSVLVQ